MNAIKKDFSLSKLIALILLLTTGLFVVFHHSAFKKAASYQMTNKVQKYEDEPLKESKFSYIPFAGSQTITRDFTAKSNEIQRVSIGFLNTKLKETKGTITVSLIDSSGNLVAKSESPAAQVLSVDTTVFDFTEEDSSHLNAGDITSKTSDISNAGIKIKKGEDYSLIVEGHDISTPGRFSIKVMKYNGDNALEEANLYAIVKYYKQQNKLFLMVLLLLLATIVFVICPLESLSEKLRNNGNKEVRLNVLFTRIIFVLVPFACVVANDLISGKSYEEIVERLGTNLFWLNMFVVALVWIVLYALINRTKWAGILTTAIWGIFAFANFALLQFRNIPLTATDLGSIGTAMDVVQNYTLVFDGYSIGAVAGCIAVIAALMSLKAYKGATVKARVVVVLITMIYAGCFYNLFFESDYMREHGITVGGFRPRNAYRINGYPLSFAITLAKAKVEKPEDYSLAKIKEIVQEYPSDQADYDSQVSEQRPNIIVVMNESFSDLNWLMEIDTKNEVLPFYNSLEKNCVKGKLHVSVFGGSTADSEYEFLTGNSMAGFSLNSVPYNSNLKDDTPSLARSLKQLGYSEAVAFHPGMRDSYNRHNAYPYLGFDKHIALDDLDNPDLVRSFVSDSYDYKIVEQEYEAFRKEYPNSPFFMFNVTIQNHGGYALKTGVLDDKVIIEDSELDENLLRQFLNLMRISDDAFKDLISYFENVEEPTVVLMFGDHQPKLGEDFTGILENRTGGMGINSAEFAEKRYQTPFVIWANYNIEEKQDVELSANYLSAYLMQTLGMPMTGFDKFRLELMKELPFYTSIGFSDSEGNVHSTADTTAEDYSDLVEKYKMLQYNNVVDVRGREESFFRLAE